MPLQPAPASTPTRRVVGRGGYFALSFGTIVGSAWLAVLGHWLGSAGPGGALLGFLLGAGVVLLIAFCYAELAARLPQAGGEFLYALRGLDARAAFAVGWFLTLDAIAVGAFEGVVLAMFVTRLLPDLTGSVLYSLLGYDITGGALMLGLTGAALLGIVNCRGLAVSVGFQRLATYVFLTVAILLLGGGLYQGSVSNLQPWFASTTDRPWWIGTVWIFATCALFLNGFQVALYAVEERKQAVSVRSVVVTMVWGLVVAVAFYCLIIISAGSMQPWKNLLGIELPAVAAFSLLGPPKLMEAVILTTACVSLLKTWNAVLIFGSQLLVAQARHGMIPRWFAGVSPGANAPIRAIAFVSVGSAALIMLGRGAVLPIVNMVSICIALTFVISLTALLKLTRNAVNESAESVVFKVPGGRVAIWTATLGAAAMAAVALIEPAIRTRGVPVEWILLAAWGFIGTAFWNYRRRAP